MGPTGCSETSLRNYDYSLSKSPEERSSQPMMTMTMTVTMTGHSAVLLQTIIWSVSIGQDILPILWPGGSLPRSQQPAPSLFLNQINYLYRFFGIVISLCRLIDTRFYYQSKHNTTNTTHAATATRFGHNQVLITITQTEKHTEVEVFLPPLSVKIHKLTVRLLFHERHCRSLQPFPPPPVSN